MTPLIANWVTYSENASIRMPRTRCPQAEYYRGFIASKSTPIEYKSFILEAILNLHFWAKFSNGFNCALTTLLLFLISSHIVVVVVIIILKVNYFLVVAVMVIITKTNVNYTSTKKKFRRKGLQFLAGERASCQESCRLLWDSRPKCIRGTVKNLPQKERWSIVRKVTAA